MIDFHSHILPNIDDGCENIQESIQLLNILENEGVDKLCLTPHFYPDYEDIDTFINRRNNSYNQLINTYKGNIKLLLGSEVRYYTGISTNPNINKLTLQDTNLLLLELPFDINIQEYIIKEIINLSKNQNLRVVLAHIERYNIDDNTLKNLKNVGILIQANTESFIHIFKNKKPIHRIKNELIDFIGSDTHNTTTRLPNYQKAIQTLSKHIDINLFNERMEAMIHE